MKPKLMTAILLLGLAGCSGDLKDVAKNLLLLAEANATLQGIVIDANMAGVLPKPKADAVVRVTKRIAQAGVEAAELTEQFAKMPESDRDELLEILDPALAAVAEALADPDISGIEDEQTSAAVQASLVTLSSLLSTIRLFLVIGGD